MLNLDSYDKAILRTIQDNGKISNQDLADLVGLSPSACLRRVKVLEDSDVICGYMGKINASKLDLTLTAVVSISMDKHIPERFDLFEKEIKAIPEIIECLLITGQSADYQLKILVKNLEHYHQILLGKITRIPGVTGVHSSFVLNKIIENRPIPVY